MTPSTLKPWPADAVMIVAPSPAEAVYAPAEPTFDGECRQCGATLACRVSSRQAAIDSPLRHSRPVLYFCIRCATEHECPPHLADLRGPSA